MRAPWLAEVLRAEGLQVVEHAGWQGRGGELDALEAVVWHHDASPPGDSPGVCDYMLGRYDVAAAQAWVSRAGAWHLLGDGAAPHAGRVLLGKPGNRDSLGVETDHTTGEPWPAEQLRGLRVGTAAILRRAGATATGLEFHRTVCSPVGRKSDPDGLDLTAERAAVARLLAREDTAMSPEDRAHLDGRLDELTAAVASLRKRLDEHAVTILRGPKHPSLTRVFALVNKIAEKVGVTP